MSAPADARPATLRPGSAPGSSRPGGVIGVLGGLPRAALIGLVRIYQLVISPWTPPTCKYYPSCSSYAVTALERHGALRGSWLAIRRLGRCHPWSDGGVDDVPPVGARGHAHGVPSLQRAGRPARQHAPATPGQTADRGSGHPDAPIGQH